MEPRRLAEERDDLADLAQRNPVILGGTRVGGLAPQAGQGGPVERPGLCDRLFLDGAGQLVEPIDQGLVDRALGGSVGMVFDQTRDRALRACALEELGEPMPPAFRS